MAFESILLEADKLSSEAWGKLVPKARTMSHSLKIGIIAASFSLVVGLAAYDYWASFPKASLKIGTPFLSVEQPQLPLSVYLPVQNLGRPTSDLGPGTAQLSITAWGSPSDIVGGSLEGRETFPAEKEMRGSGPVLVKIGAIYFVPPSRTEEGSAGKMLVGTVAHKRKYPVHVSVAWQRDRLAGEERFILLPGENVARVTPVEKAAL